MNGKLRIHLAVDDPAVRRRLVDVLRSDQNLVLVADADDADLVIAQRALTAGPVATAPHADASLTHREREVLLLLAAGLVNKEIGARLGISAHTVKFHVASVLAKLGAQSRAEAVSVGLRTGLLPL